MKVLLNLPEKKLGWVLLSTSATILFGTALVFQYVFNLAPCVMCIEERLILLSVALFSLIPVFKPSSALLRLFGYLGIIGIALLGFTIVNQHLSIQNGEAGLFATCSIFPRLPTWLPLHEWFPSIFMPTGDCGDIDWMFLTLSMVEWVKVIFIIYVCIPLMFLISRWITLNKV